MVVVGGADRGGCDVDEARQREYRELPLRRRVVGTTSRGWGPGTVRVVAFEVGVPGWYVTRGTAGCCPALHGIRVGPPLDHRHTCLPPAPQHNHTPLGTRRYELLLLQLLPGTTGTTTGSQLLPGPGSNSCQLSEHIAEIRLRTDPGLGYSVCGDT